MEKIMERIKKLLEITTANGATENEATTAALKAQKLMAEYDIELADIEDRDATPEIVKLQTDCGEGNKWKYRLHNIIAQNFRCKSYFVGKRYAIFYGFKQDAEIASQVFNFLYKTGNRLGDKAYNEYYAEHGSAPGVRNGYLAGFCQGINEVLGKQCRALMIVTPKEVTDGFTEMAMNWGVITDTLRGTKAMYDRGVADGRAVANSRSIEG